MRVRTLAPQPHLEDVGEEVGEDVGGVAERSQVVGHEDDSVKCQPRVPELLGENGTKEMVVHILRVMDYCSTWRAVENNFNSNASEPEKDHLSSLKHTKRKTTHPPSNAHKKYKNFSSWQLSISSAGFPSALC